MIGGAPFPRTAVLEGGRLQRIGGVDVGDLAARFGTPLYVLDRAELVGRMTEYRQAFGHATTVVYAAKALCTIGVLQLVDRAGLHLDCASEGELATAAAAGFPMNRVVLHGNNKSVDELEGAVRLRVGRVVVDSVTELERISALAESAGAIVRVLLRITPGIGGGHHVAVDTGSEGSKFGFSLASGMAQAAIDRAMELPGVVLAGLHCHLGSHIVDALLYDRAVEVMVELLADVRDRHHVELDELDLGGGLGIAYLPDDEVLSLETYAATIRSAVRRETHRRGLDMPHLLVEPGRSIAGPAGVTLYRVGTVKEVPGGRTFVAVDGGMSDNPRPALYGARYTVAACGKGNAEVRDRLVDVAGKHCEAGDVLIRDTALPGDVSEGDLLVVPATGAYGFSMASSYNRLPRPAVVLVAEGGARVLVDRESIDDILRGDRPLPDAT